MISDCSFKGLDFFGRNYYLLWHLKMVVREILNVINVLGYASLKIVFDYNFTLVHRVWHKISVSVASNIICCDCGRRGGRLQSVSHVYGVYVTHF
jgi:hypothetical protein